MIEDEEDLNGPKSERIVTPLEGSYFHAAIIHSLVDGVEIVSPTPVITGAGTPPESVFRDLAKMQAEADQHVQIFGENSSTPILDADEDLDRI